MGRHAPNGRGVRPPSRGARRGEAGGPRPPARRVRRAVAANTRGHRRSPRRRCAMKVAIIILIYLGFAKSGSAQEPNAEHETMHESGSPPAEEVSVIVQDLVQMYNRLFDVLMTEI